MRFTRSLIPTLKENPADAEVISHRLMVRAGMLRQVARGIYDLLPLGLRVVRKIEQIVREEMDRTGAQEILMPAICPAELWQETGRWDHYGKELLRIRDRNDRDFCFGPTHEEVVTDIVRREVRSYRDLPLTLYQVQSKFRDEIRPRFGLMRGREFLMKDAYSFHVDYADCEREYDVMFAAYTRIFERCGLIFRPVEAATGAIGGSKSHEFHVLAESGEDALVSCSRCGYAANVEKAEALAPETARPAAAAALERVDTPTQRSIDDVSAFLGVAPAQCLKTILVRGNDGLVALCVRGDHEINEIKAAKLAELPGQSVLAEEADIVKALGCKPGFIGPVNLPADIPVIVDRSAAVLADFVCGGNADGTHFRGANWERDARITRVEDLRKVVEGDASPDGQGRIRLARGIEVGHVFQLGTKYAESLNATVIAQDGKNQVMTMGCYGIGVSRIVAAAIEQNFDAAGIIWPEPMAPWRVVLCLINPKNDAAVSAAAESLYAELQARGIEVALDDRGLRPGGMFADMELIGIPHRVVVSERGVAAGTFEYRARRDSESRQLSREEVLALFAA